MKLVTLAGIALCATSQAAPVDVAKLVTGVAEYDAVASDVMLEARQAGGGLELGAGITNIVTQAITTLVPVGLQVAKTLAPLIQQFIPAAGQAASSAGEDSG